MYVYVGDIYVAPENYSLVGAGFTFTVLAVLIVALRLVTRGFLVRSVGIDDGLAVVAALGTLGFLIGAMEQIRFGLGTMVDKKTLSSFIQATVASVISYTITHMAVKLSIAFQCLRIFITPGARHLFISMICFLCVYGTICLCLTIITCWPVAKYWDDSIPGKCLDNRAMRYAFGGINIVNDIVLLVAPMPFLRNLQMPRRIKYVLMGVFFCGSAACIIACIRLYSLWDYSSVPIPERPLKGVKIALWSSLECNIAIICACVPALNPLFNRLFPGLVGSYGSSSKLPSAGQDAYNNRQNYDNIPNETRGGGSDAKGITVQTSFELRTIAASYDNESELEFVNSGRAATWEIERPSGAKK